MKLVVMNDGMETTVKTVASFLEFAETDDFDKAWEDLSERGYILLELDSENIPQEV